MTNPISRRLSRSVLLLTGILLLAVLLLSYLQASWIMNGQIEQRVQGALSSINGAVEKVLTEVGISTEDAAWAIDRSIDQYKSNPDALDGITRDFVKEHPSVRGFVLAFEPNTFPSKGRYFAPFTFMRGDSLVTTHIGSDANQYFYNSWYQIPKLLKKGAWIDPFIGSANDRKYIASYSVPLLDEKGDVYGAVISDIDVEWLTSKVDSLVVLPDSRNIMISADGKFVVNNDPAQKMHTIFTAIMDIPDSAELVSAAHAMLEGKSGIVKYKKDGEKYRFYYAPVGTNGWASGLVCREKSIFASTARFFKILALLSALALLALYFLSRGVVSHFTKPLKDFAEASKKIAEGNFNVALPDSKMDDEIHLLHESTDYMQKKLVNYIKEVQDVTANKERVESELRVAHDIQMGMVPKIFPAFPDRKDVDIYATIIPAKEVGGDLYDFFIDGDLLHFIVGDVSGKGVPASLVMAVARSMFRTLAAKEKDPAKILSQMNDSMSESNTSDMFVTAFVGVLNLSTGHLEYCNGGHNPPMIVGPEKGDARFLDIVPNLPVCTIGGFEFKGQWTDMDEGSTIFLYTDGLTEAENASKELYGEDRLAALMEKEGSKAPKELVADVLSSVEEHVKDAPQSDDLTILAIKYI